MAYTGTNIKDLDVTTPTEGATLISEFNDSDREIKTVLKNQYAITALSSGHTLGAHDSVVLCDATAGGFNVTLPTVSTVSSAAFSKVYIIKKIITDTSSNAITIVGTVDGVVNPTIVTSGDSRIIIGDGTSWHMIQASTVTLSGATIDGGTIGGTTPPLAYTKMPVVKITTSPVTLTAAECYGTWVHVSGAASRAIVLPAAIEGMNLIVFCAAAQKVTIDPDGVEYITVNGASLGAGYKAVSNSLAGDTIMLMGQSGYWIVPGSCSWTGEA